MKKSLILILLMALLLAGCDMKLSKAKNLITIDEAKAKAADFINNNLMQPGSKVSIKEVAEENELYKIVVNMTNGQEVIAYMTKDGKTFFPQAMDIEQIEAENAEKAGQEQAAAAQTAANTPKTDKPVVELFVMSHCPYGTQIEKGILPVVEKLGNKIDFELKFCDYAMHGEKELQEQLKQYCIQKNEPQKLMAYLSCFLDKGDSASCITQANVNSGALNSCVTATDKQYKVTEKFNDQSTWSGGRYPAFDVYQADNEKYGVGGSPTLVINGKTVSSARDASSLLKAICAGFNEEPSECSASLSTATPAPGFGYDATGSDSSGGCGS